MRTLKNQDLIRENEIVVKKSQKHDANLQKNPVLFFQVGLIVCLLAAYGLLEMKFESKESKVVDLTPIDNPNDFFIDPIFIHEAPKQMEPLMDKKAISKSLDPEVVPDDAPVTPFDHVPEPTVKQPSIDPSSVPVIKLVEEIPIPIDIIEQVPIYPGCEKEKSNDAKRKCMSDKITKLIQKQFDSNLAGELGLTGRQVIRTQFKIDKTGHVTDIKTQALHPRLNEEAQRVINKIPEMTPGKQHNKNVGVLYSLPIIFQVQN